MDPFIFYWMLNEKKNDEQLNIYIKNLLDLYNDFKLDPYIFLVSNYNYDASRYLAKALCIVKEYGMHLGYYALKMMFSPKKNGNDSVNELMNFVMFYDICSKNNQNPTTVNFMLNKIIEEIKANYEKTMTYEPKDIFAENDDSFSFEKTKASDTVLEKESYPLLSNYFFKGENTILLSPPGVGKSLLSVEVGKKSLLRSLYLILEDYNGKQRLRYQCLDRADIIDPIRWKDILEKTKKEELKRLGVEAMNYAMYPASSYTSRFFQKSESLSKSRGVAERIRITPVDAIKKIIDLYDRQNDKLGLVCIDTYLAFKGDMELGDREISSLLEFCSEREITLLVIHHVNNYKKFYGKKTLVQKFDNVYFLDSLTYFDEDKNMELLSFSISKSRHHPPEDSYVLKEMLDTHTCKYYFIEDILNNPDILANYINSNELAMIKKEPTKEKIEEVFKKYINKDVSSSVSVYKQWDKIRELIKDKLGEGNIITRHDLLDIINKNIKEITLETLKNTLTKWCNDKVLSYNKNNQEELNIYLDINYFKIINKYINLVTNRLGFNPYQSVSLDNSIMTKGSDNKVSTFVLRCALCGRPNVINYQDNVYRMVNENVETKIFQRSEASESLINKPYELEYHSCKCGSSIRELKSHKDEFGLCNDDMLRAFLHDRNIYLKEKCTINEDVDITASKTNYFDWFIDRSAKVHIVNPNKNKEIIFEDSYDEFRKIVEGPVWNESMKDINIQPKEE